MSNFGAAMGKYKTWQNSAPTKETENAITILKINIEMAMEIGMQVDHTSTSAKTKGKLLIIYLSSCQDDT